MQKSLDMHSCTYLYLLSVQVNLMTPGFDDTKPLTPDTFKFSACSQRMINAALDRLRNVR